MFSGARNVLIEAIKMTLDHYVRCKSNMAPNMAANIAIYLTVQSDLIRLCLSSFFRDTEHI